MPLQSMTGFARREGSSGRHRWAWELRSVNGKGLDIRLRLPQGLERFEPDCRRLASEYFARGNLQIGLNVSGAEAAVEAVVNQGALSAVLRLREQLGDLVDPAPLKFDTLLSIRGIVDFREPEESESERAARDADILSGLGLALGDLRSMREEEGTALGQILLAHVDRIEQLTAGVESDPSRSPSAIAERLAQQVALLMEGVSSLDRERLHAEVALLATKADLREEIDRLGSHVAAARDLLAKGGPVGRKLDFLAQEFNRESNTICSKSNAAAVSAAGIELKVVIDQFREQVQNLE
ncbi:MULTISPECIES: YicC/YloC family endoribonuclease [unclassified Sinorhizobium]|uniref:YicC/YloC family endoribonuclease n=1 Tax=unclassified Sinorhizobium TaxID=2613772 RepID=UPI0024C3694B|nr:MULTISPECIES: YicC/YloC family endoribonuclease [unclassified Sinorhizobium]MDK1376346.1 YicC/YloC family endoribonuclease [Sinorhizobium sp. 6-70]MDK1478151.1 YicC/YloC family endoribonuclease [Sinorhizobium sp. 6-117]